MLRVLRKPELSTCFFVKKFPILWAGCRRDKAKKHTHKIIAKRPCYWPAVIKQLTNEIFVHFLLFPVFILLILEWICSFFCCPLTKQARWAGQTSVFTIYSVDWRVFEFLIKTVSAVCPIWWKILLFDCYLRSHPAQS